MEPSILYEDPHVVVVNKPSGVMTHPDGKNFGESVSEWFSARYPESANVGEAQKLPDGTLVMRPGIVHRLDRETSGVLVLAKTQEAYEFLQNAFQEKQIEKTYLAFVYGVPKEEKGTIEFSIGRSRKDFRLRSAQPKAKGVLREAVTRYEVIAKDEGGAHSFLKVTPLTGRTHQIRVHLKAIHHPVVCDSLYAPNHACDLSFARLGLHAFRLQIPLPVGKSVLVTAPFPEDLTAGLLRFPGGADIVASL